MRGGWREERYGGSRVGAGGATEDRGSGGAARGQGEGWRQGVGLLAVRVRSGAERDGRGAGGRRRCVRVALGEGRCRRAREGGSRILREVMGAGEIEGQ